MNKKKRYTKQIVLAVFCLVIAISYYANILQEQDPYDRGLKYGAQGKIEKAWEMFYEIRENNRPYIISVRQLLKLTYDVMKGRVEKETARHLFRGAKYHTRYQRYMPSAIEIWKMLEEADYESKSMKYLDKAIEEYKTVIASNPDIAAAHHALGRAYESKRSSKAIEEYKKAITIDPDESLTHYFLGVYYYNKGMLDEAIEEMKKVEALGIKPICQLSVQSILGLAYHRIGKYDLAVKHLEKFFALGGKSKVNAKFLSMAKAAQKNTN